MDRPEGVADLEVDKTTLDWSVSFAHRGITFWYFMLAAICLFGPNEWFGPTWWYFQYVPHGGFGLGVTCLILGLAMVYAIWRRRRTAMRVALSAGALAIWISAALIGAQGVIGHTGLMESPFMMYVAFDIGIQSALLSRR